MYKNTFFCFAPFLFFGLLLLSCNNNQIFGFKALNAHLHLLFPENIYFQKLSSQNFKTDISLPKVSNGTLVVVQDYIPDIVLDIRYATTNNFVKTVLYDCPECMLRASAVKALAKAQEEFKLKGFRIKAWDCYRPKSVQLKLWNKVPNARYVANPFKKGSYHNRGVAIDMTIVDSVGNEVNMGTTFDFFGREASPTYLHFPDSILNNRKYLFDVMKNNGFTVSKSEWWHFTHFISDFYPIIDEPFPCSNLPK